MTLYALSLDPGVRTGDKRNERYRGIHTRAAESGVARAHRGHARAGDDVRACPSQWYFSPLSVGGCTARSIQLPKPPGVSGPLLSRNQCPAGAARLLRLDLGLYGKGQDAECAARGDILRSAGAYAQRRS